MVAAVLHSTTHPATEGQAVAVVTKALLLLVVLALMDKVMMAATAHQVQDSMVQVVVVHLWQVQMQTVNLLVLLEALVHHQA